MKRIYLTPQTTIVKIGLEQRLLADSLKIHNKEIDADAMTKDQGSWGNVWGSDDDDEE